MADKGTLEAIDKLRAARPRQLLDIVDGMIVQQQNFSTAQEALAAGLRFLVEDFRRQAELVMDSGARGKGAEATALRSTASALSLLAGAVEQVDLDGAGEVLPVPSRGGPKLPAEWCGKTEDHGPHLWEHPASTPEEMLERGPLRRECTGHHPRDLTGLDALVTERSSMQMVTFDTEPMPEDMPAPGVFTAPKAGIYGVSTDGTKALVEERAGVQVIHVPSGAFTGGLNTIPLSTPIEGPAVVAFQFADPAGAFTSAVAGAMEAEQQQARTAAAGPARRDGELAAWLSGGTNTMPPIRSAPEPQKLAAEVSGIAAAVLQVTQQESDAFVTPRVNTPENREAAASMFVDPKPLPGADPVMPGRRLSWADLRQAPAGPVPEHLSFSQGGTLDECGLQYRLERLEPGVVQRPRWANVGGKALHAAAEWFELQVAKAPGSAEYARARIEISGGYGAIWAKYFAAALAEQAIATPSVPPADWKAGGRGQSEGWTWWQVEGEAMLQRYLDGRLDSMDSEHAPVVVSTLDSEYMIEHEGLLMVEGIPVKVVIDQVWRGETFGLPEDSIVVDDLKSGAYAPKGSYQLGLYAWYLKIMQGFQGKIYGRFWDARKGAYSDPVDLLNLHPWDEIALRVQGQQAKKDGGIYTPAPDWQRCGACQVKHACPAALTRG